ncbi:peptidyl-tRNA hydrolase [Dothidotthia symphoricarpi CBS 119687]|uniref:peptidyl-tRNA hydrolase n=1 Tax=Dothidotthia symphoricarpi CBS 119687 TaxID=1392245 RepID=A0A6A6A9G8_9PLEO|nr:peptidyl-tRNA hydrolase [Dothidotthia symphoricarpi CBS 119687]KAF2128449.1 peptidyl-tRNA hydrolase [Dothidotthia symphoricarpi CBS 119687]
MADASTRAHVNTAAPFPSPIPAARTPKNIEPPTPDDTDSETPSTTTTPLSRKEKRKRQKHTPPTPPDTENEHEPSPSPTPHRKPANHPAKPRTTALPPPMATPKAAKAVKAAQGPFSLLICSIGNPGALYANTFHSAGHTLTNEIAMRKSYKPFTRGLSGMVSRPDNTVLSWSITGYTASDGGPPDDDWTFWQSTSLMNVSGVGVKRAYTEWLRQVRAAGREGRLVVVHDELEAPLGKVAVRESWASSRGHNGLKSIQQQLGGVKWWRVSVGIGRPESRGPQEVSRYVLRKMTGGEKSVLEKSAVGVVDALRAIAEGKR